MTVRVFSTVFPPPKFTQRARDEEKNHKGSAGMGGNISTTNEADGGFCSYKLLSSNIVPLISQALGEVEEVNAGTINTVLVNLFPMGSR